MSDTYIYRIYIIHDNDLVGIIATIIAHNDEDVGRYIKSNEKIMIKLTEKYLDLDCDECDGGSLGTKIKSIFTVKSPFDKRNDEDIKKMKEVINSYDDKDLLVNTWAIGGCEVIGHNKTNISNIDYAITEKDIDIGERKDYVKDNLTKLLMNKKL